MPRPNQDIQPLPEGLFQGLPKNNIKPTFVSGIFEYQPSSLDLEKRVEALENIIGTPEHRERMERIRLMGFVFPGDR